MTIVVYLEKLKYYAKEYEVKVHAFVLMTNHVHLLATPTTSNGVSKLINQRGQSQSKGSESIKGVRVIDPH